MATLLSAEIIEAIRFVYGEEPGTITGYHAGGGSFTSPDMASGRRQRRRSPQRPD